MHFLLFILLCLAASRLEAQESFDEKDTIPSIRQIPLSYISAIEKKVAKYTQRINSRTEKTLEKLSRWENKIKNTLQKLGPQAVEQLFGEGQQTFSSVLQNIMAGKKAFDDYQQQYDKYRDDLTTEIKYLAAQKENLGQKFIHSINGLQQKIDSLNEQADQTEALQQFIRERKKQLITVSLQHIGKSKYLDKINKEAWYHAETIRNYKQLFNDETKLEQTAKTVLNSLPAFQQFIKSNSMLAGLFDIPGSPVQLLPGMQTRSSVQQLISNNIAVMGPSAQQMVSNNIQSARGQLSQLQDNIIKKALGNNGGGYGEMPDFKPNTQKTKTFAQRIEYGFNLQFGKSNSLLPAATDITLSIGYKLNDKSTAGVGASYKLGMGSIDHIKFSNEGIGLRSFIDWKLKMQFFIYGGLEMNYNSQVKNIPSVKKGNNGWQRSALLGLTKKFSIRTKWFKSTSIQLLYDFLAQAHIPVSRQWLFRIGYGF
ncbi:MAG: hypothetical protein QM791_18530 [Ferruginibacter sp.]